MNNKYATLNIFPSVSQITLFNLEHQISADHVLETDVYNGSPDQTLNHQAFINKMQLQYFDAKEDNQSNDWSYLPTAVLAHKISNKQQKIVKDANSTKIKIVKDRHVRVQTCWKNGEVSWVAADALKEQNPWVIIQYATRNKLQKHPDFIWTKPYLENKQVIANLLQLLTVQSDQGMKYKFGVQIPRNASHALYLDKINNDHLWKEAMDKEIGSINSFETFKVMDEGEVMPPGYVKIPYHYVWDCIFDGR